MDEGSWVGNSVTSIKYLLKDLCSSILYPYQHPSMNAKMWFGIVSRCVLIKEKEARDDVMAFAAVVIDNVIKGCGCIRRSPPIA